MTADFLLTASSAGYWAEQI